MTFDKILMLGCWLLKSIVYDFETRRVLPIATDDIFIVPKQMLYLDSENGSCE